jgi:hypothetical protein
MEAYIANQVSAPPAAAFDPVETSMARQRSGVNGPDVGEEEREEFDPIDDAGETIWCDGKSNDWF